MTSAAEKGGGTRKGRWSAAFGKIVILQYIYMAHSMCTVYDARTARQKAGSEADDRVGHGRSHPGTM